MTDAAIIFASCFVASLATSAFWLFLGRVAALRAAEIRNNERLLNEDRRRLDRLLQEDRSQLANRENLAFHSTELAEKGVQDHA